MSKSGKSVFACKAGLKLSVEFAGRSEQSAIMAAEQFANCVAHPSDLGVVWMMNQMILAARVLRQYLGNVSAYFEGKPYWAKVEWESLAGASPYPTYGLEDVDTLILG